MAGQAPAGSAGHHTPAVASAWAKGPPTSLRTSSPPSASISFFPPIKLAARQPGSKEGFPAISFTSAEVQEGRHRLQHSLVAKFSGGRPKVEVVRRAFIEAWSLDGVASIGAWDARHILVVLKSEEDAKRVLAHPMRKVDQYFFWIFRWSPDFHARKESTVVTTWVRLPAFPPELFDQGYIKPIISMIGNFIAIDEKTRALSNPCFARACVEVDVSKDIPEKVWVGLGGQGYWQYLEFENNLFYCTRCKVHSHPISSCRKVRAAGVADKEQARMAPKDFSNQAFQPPQAPAMDAAASDNTQSAQKSSFPPLEHENPCKIQLDKAGLLDQEGWQVQKKKKKAKKGPAMEKVFRVKPTHMEHNKDDLESGLDPPPALQPGLEPLPALQTSDSAPMQPELDNCIIATLETVPLAEVSNPMESFEAPAPPSEAVIQLPNNISPEDQNPPGMSLDIPSLPIEPQKAPNCESIAAVNPNDCSNLAAHSKSGSSSGGSKKDLPVSGSSGASSVQRKILSKAERKAEKAARKEERKAKYNRKENFVFED